MLIADGQNSVIRRVSAATGTISTVAGIGIVGDATPGPGSSVADVALGDPRGVAGLADGSFAIADAGLRAVLLVTPNGLAQTLLDRRSLLLPVDVVAVDDHNLLVVDADAGTVLEVDVRTHSVRNVARGLNHPWRVVPDPSAPGGLIVSEHATSSGSDGTVVRVAPGGATRTVIAGPGAAGMAGALKFERVTGVAAGTDGAVIVADRHWVYAIYRSGAYSRFAVAEIGQSEGITAAGGKLLIADSANNRIVEIPEIPPPAPPCATCTVALSGVAGVAPRSFGLRARAAQAPGAVVCQPGSLPRGVKALHIKRQVLSVKFPFAGLLQVGIVPVDVSNPGETRIFRRNFLRAPPNSLVQFAFGRRQGMWYIRVRGPGGCNDSDPVRFGNR